MRKFLSTIICLTLILPIFAINTFKYESVLSKGKWVKVTITESGVYELPYSTLKEYGFTNPSKVKVFGKGGNALPENILQPIMDDLVQTPTMHKNNKIYFYAKGISNDSIKTTFDGTKYFFPKPNTYSKTGALFLTEDSSEAPLMIENLNSISLDNISTWEANGYSVWTYEEELYNPGLTGKTFLGANIAKEREITFKPNLPAYNPTGKIFLTDRLCMVGSSDMETQCQWNGLEMSKTSNNIVAANDRIGYLEYNSIDHSAMIDATPSHDNKFTLRININTAGQLKKAWVDYATILYPTYLQLSDTEAQIRHFVDIKRNCGLQFPRSSIQESLIWLVNEQNASTDYPYSVKNCITETTPDGQNVFAINKADKWLEFVIFDPNKTQKTPKYAGIVKNQNLHSIRRVPTMLIITNSILLSEAERLADFHRTFDNMEVLVVNQDEIFNEFSGGNRDAMAYRLFCKMLYERDPQRFNYLLLFGKGTYDNRMLYTNENSEQLITYQSETSYNQTKSYCSDDFFGFLDNTSYPLIQQKLRIAIGRIPVSSQIEAKIYIDKLINYSYEQLNGDNKWRNNIMLIAENGDDDIHLEQCETFKERMLVSGNYDNNFNKLYLACFNETNVREKFLEYLNSGQYFGLYVGHGTPNSLTKSQIITNLDKGKETKYPHLPIMYFSSCDVARYDNGGSNIVSAMFTNEDGGLIATVASTRVVYTNLNGKLSDSFATSLAKLPSYYNNQKTLGNVFKDAKNNSNENSINKLKFCILGDPSIRLTPPENYIYLTSINGQQLQKDSKIEVAAGDKVTIEGVIRKPWGPIENFFLGTVLIQLYDQEKFIVSALKTDASNTRVYTDIYNRGKLLNQTTADVFNGNFKCTITIPEFTETLNGNNLVIRMFAETNNMTSFSGSNENLVINRTLPSKLPQDTECPTINNLYIDNMDTFEEGMTVGSNFTVFGDVTDNGVINTSTEFFHSSISIALDSNKKSTPIYNYEATNETSGSFSIPFYDVENGRHTIEVAITDINGNIQRRNISFIVDSKLNRNLIVTNQATATSATFDIDNAENIKSAEIFITDSKGNILYNTPVNSFPYEWNLTDNNGVKLAPGDYDAYAKINNIGTDIKKIVILKQ